MDEFGHLIDSTHLDSVGGDHKVHNQDAEPPQTAPHADGANPGSLSKFVSGESPAAAQSLGIIAEKDISTFVDATAPQTQREPHNLKGGSASESWLGSSVTGWFGLTAAEKCDSTGEGEEQDEIQPEDSLTSTVAGWLWLREQDDVTRTTEEISVTADSFASTMTGWFGFGGKEKIDHMSEREQDAEEKYSGLEQEPEEKYRSRRMSMNIKDTDEEMEGTSTLEWLGNGLLNRFSLSLSSQESEHAEPTDRDPKQTTVEEEQPSSWFDIDIGDILGFKKGKIDVDGGTGSNFRGREKPTEQSRGSENVNSESDPPEIEVSPGSVDSVTDDSHGDDMHQGTLDSSKDRLPAEGSAYRDVQKDIPTQLGVSSQAVGGMSSMFNGLFHKGRDEDVQDNVLDDSPKRIVLADGEQSAGMENKEHQMPSSIEETKRKPGEENVSVKQSLPQNLAATSSSQEDSDFLRPPTGEDGKRDSEEKADIPDFKDNTDMFPSSRASRDGEDGRDYGERTLPKDNSIAQGQASEGVNDHSAYSEIIQPILSSGSAGEYREQVSNEDDSLINQVTSVDHFNSLLMADKMPDDTEDIAGVIQSPHSEDRSLGNMSTDVSEDSIGKTSQMTTDDHNTAGQKSETDADADIIQENGAGDDVLKENVLQTPVEREAETEDIEKHKTTEDLMRKEKEVKSPDNQMAANEVELEEVTEMENEIKGEETQGEEDETARKQVAELTLEEEKVKKVEKQQKEFRTKDKTPADKIQESEEDLKKEEEALAEEKRIGARQSSHHFKADMENRLQTETQSEASSSTFTQTETLQDEEEGSDLRKKVKMKEEDSQEILKDEQRDGPGCLEDYCSEAPAGSLARDRDGSTLGTEWSSTHGEDTHTGEQHLPTERDPDIAERIGGMDFESMEKEESRKQEERDNLDSAANVESAGNESDGGDNMKDVSDKSKDLQYSSVTEDDHLLSTKLERTRYTEDSILRQGEKNKSDIEMVNNITSDDHKIDSVANSGKAEVLVTKDDDRAGPDLGSEVRTDSSVSQHPTSSLPSDGKNIAEDEGGGGFSRLKGAFGFFSQSSVTKLVQNLDSNAGEAEGSLTADPELDLTTVSDQSVLTVPSITPPQPPESQPSPPPIQLPSSLHPQSKSLSANPHHPHQTKILSKHYKSLLTHMSVDEIAILLEYFGRHKLQFLDYICGSSQPMSEELDHDESILLDVERLLHYHLEALKEPRMRPTDPPQEEKEKSQTLIALDKLQMLVTRVKEMFNRRKLDIRSTYHQGISACFGQD